MGYVSVDMTNVSDGFEPIAEGKARFAIVNAEQRHTKTGKTFINWECIVQQGEDTGKKAWIRTFLNPEALWVLKSLIEAVTGEKVQKTMLEFDPEEFYGKEFNAEVTHNYTDVENSDGSFTSKIYVNIDKFTAI